MYEEVCLRDTTKYGMKKNPERTRNQHTTEQKTWGAGYVLDALLQPMWKESILLFYLFKAATPKSFTDALENVKFFGGDLIFTHTLEYLQLWDADCQHPIFKCRMTKEVLSQYIKAGKNSAAFLRIANACGQRGEPGKRTFQDMCARVWQQLPQSIEFEHGAPSAFPHFCATDGSQNACKCVEVYQTLLTGSWAGKARPNTPPAPQGRVKKIALKRPAAQRARRGK